MPQRADGGGGKGRSEVLEVGGTAVLAPTLLAKRWVRSCLFLGVSPCAADNPAMNVRLLPLHLCWGLGGEEGMGKGLLI